MFSFEDARLGLAGWPGETCPPPGVLGCLCSLQGPMSRGRPLLVHPSCQPAPRNGSCQCDQRLLGSSGAAMWGMSHGIACQSPVRSPPIDSESPRSRSGTVKSMTARSETVEDLTVPKPHILDREIGSWARAFESGQDGTAHNPSRWRSCLRVALFARPRFAQSARSAPLGPPCTHARQIVSHGPTRR